MAEGEQTRGAGEPLVLTGFGAPMYIDRDLSFRDAVNHQALAYWRSKHGDKAMPSRADLDPVEMRAFVANVGLVEVLREAGATTPRFRVRLAGTAVEEVFGPLTGQMVAELPAYFSERWHNLFLAATEACAPVRLTTDVMFKDKDYLTAEALMAPLSDDGSIVSMLFICVRFWPQSRPPSRR